MSDLHIPSLKCLANCLEDSENLKVKKINFELEKWGYSCKYAKFSEKLIFLVRARIMGLRNNNFSENFVHMLINSFMTEAVII